MDTCATIHVEPSLFSMITSLLPSTSFFLGLCMGAVLMLLAHHHVERACPPDTRSQAKSTPRVINPSQAKRKQENLTNIRDYIASHNTITNNDVEKLANVTHATAERYLQQLEQEGLLRQHGTIGRAVTYRKV